MAGRNWTQRHIEELIKKTVDEYGPGPEPGPEYIQSMKYPPYIYHHPFTIPSHGLTGNMLTTCQTPSSLFVTNEGYAGMEVTFNWDYTSPSVIDVTKPVGFYTVDNEANQQYLSRMDEFVTEGYYDVRFNNPYTLYNCFINNQAFGFLKYMYIENYNVHIKRAYFPINPSTDFNLFREDPDERKNLTVQDVGGESRGHLLYLTDASKTYLSALMTQLKLALDSREGKSTTALQLTIIGRSFTADTTWADNINPDYFFNDYYKLF